MSARSRWIINLAEQVSNGKEFNSALEEIKLSNKHADIAMMYYGHDNDWYAESSGDIQSIAWDLIESIADILEI